ncbi:MAG: signal peptidase I [Treponema sp.]|jgi:signal peptidase I|nr:signal peptidase I [Treponema sp.]
MNVDIFLHKLTVVTENILSRRRKKIRIRKEKQQNKNFIVDWLEALLWAAGVVLLINQYLIQAYQIPSGSMTDTLMIKDHIFVNKLIFGPEILPGLGKIPSPFKPQRNEVIIFENPSYISRGPLFDIIQRILYMVTFSFVDIDREESGEPRVHFLIKRAIGMPGDTVVLDRGEILIRFAGEKDFIPEREYNRQRAFSHTLSRLMETHQYPTLEYAGTLSAYQDLKLNPPDLIVEAARPAANLQYPDYFAYEKARLQFLQAANPQENRYRMRLAQLSQGWYIPEGRIFPLGDNRDNSRDARYFGAVRTAKVLGQGTFIYWPLGRIGLID